MPNQMPSPRLTGLVRHPVKSARGEALTRARVEPWGLAGDRRWMLVDPEGEAVTAREVPRLLLVVPRLLDGGGLELSMDGTLRVEVPEAGPAVPVTVFGRTPFEAALAADEAHAWLSDRLGRPVRLVHAQDPRRREANPAFAPPRTPMAFQDGYPLMVTTTASLGALNAWIAAGDRPGEGPLEMERFRPNLVVDGTEAWAEDGWRRLRVGAATFQVVKGCDRCAIPATDPLTAVRFKEPTATLARHRRFDGAVWFGMDLVPEPDAVGVEVVVGDEVEVLESVPAPDGPPR